MSNHFCGTCNRLRITADGHLRVCLFGKDGYSLTGAMRDGMSDEEIVGVIAQGIRSKKAALGGHGTPEGVAKDALNDGRPMILIGG